MSRLLVCSKLVISLLVIFCLLRTGEGEETDFAGNAISLEDASEFGNKPMRRVGMPPLSDDDDDDDDDKSLYFRGGGDEKNDDDDSGEEEDTRIEFTAAISKDKQCLQICTRHNSPMLTFDTIIITSITNHRSHRHYNTNTATFTAPVDGLYIFSIRIQLQRQRQQGGRQQPQQPQPEEQQRQHEHTEGKQQQTQQQQQQQQPPRQHSNLHDISIVTDNGKKVVCSISSSQRCGGFTPEHSDGSSPLVQDDSQDHNTIPRGSDDLDSAQWDFVSELGQGGSHSDWDNPPCSPWERTPKRDMFEGSCEGITRLLKGQNVFVKLGHRNDSVAAADNGFGDNDVIVDNDDNVDGEHGKEDREEEEEYDNKCDVISGTFSGSLLTADIGSN